MRTQAQVPGVDWQTIDALPERPPGQLFTWNTSMLVYDETTELLTLGIDSTMSGIDWHNDMALLRASNGDHIGYAVSGYSWIPNMLFNTPCNTPVFDPIPLPVNFMETFEYRQGSITGTVAVYDLNGVRQWYHTYMAGAFFGVTQDKNGDLVVTGVTGQAAPWANVPWTTQPLYYNPTAGQQFYDIANAPCDNREGKLIILKIDPDNGNVIWNHVYGVDADTSARHTRTFGYSLVEVDPDGNGGYRAVGYWRGASDHLTLPNRNRPFVVDVDANGLLNWKQAWDDSHPSMYWATGNGEGQAFYIARHPDPAVEKYLITGLRAQNPGGGSGTSAFLMYYDGNGQTPVWWEDTRINATEYGLSGASRATSNRVILAERNGTTSIVWPVLTDLIGSAFANVNHEAIGRVYRMDLNGDLPGARTTVNTALGNDPAAWWEVQDMHLSQLESGLTMEAVSIAQEAQLSAIAASGERGAGRAKAWLAALGSPASVDIVLPNMNRSMQFSADGYDQINEIPLLGVYPNPSQGEAFITYQLPEGMEAASLEMHDPLGRLLWSRSVTNSSGIEELPRDVPPGIYHVTLRGGNVQVGSVKFTAVR